MPVSRTNPSTGQPVPPSSVSIGKKPMNYSTTQQQPQQQQPKSARAASKAPLYTQQQQQQQQQQQNRHPSPPTSNASTGTKARQSGGTGGTTNSGPTSAQKGKANANKIWSTSTTEERERIKDFWLGLGEPERRNLVKIEKDTVLRKMKEQQKHSCSCAVCGRKRNAIEEELEVLYDAYYEELEQYANYQQRYVSSGGTIPPPPGPGPFPGSVELDKNGAVVSPAPANQKQRERVKQPPQSVIVNGRKQHPHPQPHHHPPPPPEDEQEEEEYDVDEYEEEEEEEEEEEPEEEEEEEEEEDDDDDELQRQQQQQQQVGRRIANGRSPKGQPIPAQKRSPNTPQAPTAERRNKGRDGLFNIGSSLTVTGPGNILTVADDLLKNDGQKFLEMMEQLAERRMQREEDAAGAIEAESDEDSEDDGDGSDRDDDGDDDGVSEDDEDDEDEEDGDEETMSEEQKMEEGKRMFSIFAARMFEQRVLQAYREKVAQERQLQLLRELDDEDKITKDREMKRQNQNQKKKDKKRQQKQAKEEERALKAADKAAEEAAAKARQAALDEESRKKREDDRLKREAAKKVMDEEKARKDEERKKRALEERERELERERKKKEKDYNTKKVREERERKAKEEREERERKAKGEREARLAKEKEEKAEKDRIEREKKEEKVEKEKKAAKEKAEKEAMEKLAAQQQTAAASASASTLASGSGKGSARANNAVASSSTATTPVKSNSPSTSSVAAPALQRLPNNSSGSNGNDTTPKKPANKPIPTLVTTPLPPGILGQGTRPAVQQPNLPRPSHLPPPTPINPQQPHLPQPPHSAGMMYGPQGPVGIISPSAMSPRVGSFPPMAYGYGGPNMQQQHPPPLSPVPARGFNGGSFDPTFNRGMPVGVGVPLGALPPPPIGPPTKAAKSAAQGTASAGLAPGQGRHASASSNDASGPGPITRPMAPIARPTAGGGNGEAASSGSGSPNRRSPSPSRVLGSSALAADDDEVVSAHVPRRAATIGIGTMPIGGPGGQNWGSASPRSALSEANLRAGPWTASSFSSARSAIGPNNHLHQLHHPGPVSPSLWGNTPGNGSGENWHPQSPAFFSGSPYINHNTAASSTPHTST